MLARLNRASDLLETTLDLTETLHIACLAGAAFTVVSSAVEVVVKIDRIDRAFVITTSEFGGGDAVLGSRWFLWIELSFAMQDE